MSVRPAPLLALLLAVALLAGGCTGDEPDAAPTADATVSEVRAARQAVAEPAVALHDAVSRLLAVVGELRASTVEEPDARLEELRTLPEEPLEELEEAIATAGEVELDGSSAPVVAAREALDDALAGARRALTAARADLAEQERAAEAHRTLRSLTGRWDAPGSRSQQLDRFAALARDADALATELEAVEPVAPCLTGIERRAAAARAVAEATRELRGHIEAYRGEQFDRRREQLADDPFGLEQPLVTRDIAELGCWRDEAPLVTAAAEVRAALRGVEQALNPTTLNPRTATPTP